jgi:hypothetical protein
MRAALVTNLPNYDTAIVSAKELVDSISFLETSEKSAELLIRQIASSAAAQFGNHPERSNIELPVYECRCVRNETAKDWILPMSVQKFLRFVTLVEEPQSGICCGAMQIVDHYSGIRTGR